MIPNQKELERKLMDQAREICAVDRGSDIPARIWTHAFVARRLDDQGCGSVLAALSSYAIELEDERAKLRARIAELETEVGRLTSENARLRGEATA